MLKMVIVFNVWWVFKACISCDAFQWIDLKIDWWNNWWNRYRMNRIGHTAWCLQSLVTQEPNFSAKNIKPIIKINRIYVNSMCKRANIEQSHRQRHCRTSNCFFFTVSSLSRSRSLFSHHRSQASNSESIKCANNMFVANKYSDK